MDDMTAMCAIFCEPSCVVSSTWMHYIEMGYHRLTALLSLNATRAPFSSAAPHGSCLRLSFSTANIGQQLLRACIVACVNDTNAWTCKQETHVCSTDLDQLRLCDLVFKIHSASGCISLSMCMLKDIITLAGECCWTAVFLLFTKSMYGTCQKAASCSCHMAESPQ